MVTKRINRLELIMLQNRINNNDSAGVYDYEILSEQDKQEVSVGVYDDIKEDIKEKVNTAEK